MTPVPRENYRIGLPKPGKLKEIFNSDLKKYGGSGKFRNKIMASDKIDCQYRKHSLEIVIPPLGMVVFKYQKTSK
jgi:1,4-alpha-glucan branching enzyme